MWNGGIVKELVTLLTESVWSKVHFIWNILNQIKKLHTLSHWKVKISKLIRDQTRQFQSPFQPTPSMIYYEGLNKNLVTYTQKVDSTFRALISAVAFHINCLEKKKSKPKKNTNYLKLKQLKHSRIFSVLSKCSSKFFTLWVLHNQQTLLPPTVF